MERSFAWQMKSLNLECFRTVRGKVVEALEFMISASTDIGTVKKTNQDSLSVKLINTCQGHMVFAVLCDGMGGLEKGEVASGAVIRAFDTWVTYELPRICENRIEDAVLRRQWGGIIADMNRRIQIYGAGCGVRLGTTVVAMLLTHDRYYILNVGDSRAYELTDCLKQLTNDQTFVAREIALGNMTEDEARLDERRNVLLQCVGASDEVYPDMFFGDVKKNTVYMLCSDGFRHEVLPEEIFEKLQPSALLDEESMQRNTVELIELNKNRNERDNISVVLVRTF